MEALAIAERSPYGGNPDDAFDIHEGVMFLSTAAPEAMPHADVQRMGELRWIWDGRYRCWAKCL